MRIIALLGGVLSYSISTAEFSLKVDARGVSKVAQVLTKRLR